MDYVVTAVVAVLAGMVFITLIEQVRFIVVSGPESEVAQRSTSCVWHYHKFRKWFSRDEDGNFWILQIVIHAWYCTSEQCPRDGSACQRPGAH